MHITMINANSFLIFFAIISFSSHLERIEILAAGLP